MRKIIILFVLLSGLYGVSAGVCDGYKVFILCNPRTPVNVRISPKKGTDIVGRLDFGDWIETDGEKRNGFLHVYGIGEYGDGWIFAGYTVETEPLQLDSWAIIEASGRVMSYRWIGGRKNGWIKVGERVKVYGLSDDWAVTSKGYIRTKYLEGYRNE